MSNAVAVAVDEAQSSASGILTTTRNAIQDGIADARATVEEAWPKVTEAVGKGVYKLAYGLAFGVTFPVLLVAKSIPQNNCVVWGLVDGSKAAREAVGRLTAK
jgi:hypothetical protein